MADKADEKTRVNDTKYSKKQFLNSNNYKNNYDLINALLDDKVLYSKTEVEQKVDEYLKKEVL